MDGVASGNDTADVTKISLPLSRTATVDRPMTKLGSHAAESSHDTTITRTSQAEPKSQSEEEPENEDEKQPCGLELDKEELLGHRTWTLPTTFARFTVA